MSNQDKPLVSVIIPTHNRGQLLVRAIQSVLAQTFSDFEIIVVDDGSIDNTKEVVRGFKDPRIRFFHHEQNRGPSAARNTAIRAARGRYVTFLDSDDEYAPEKLQEQMCALGKNEGERDSIVIVTGTLHLFDFPTMPRKIWPVINLRPCPEGHIYESFWALKRIKVIASMLVSRECLEKVNLFDEALRASEFWDLGIRLAKNCRYEVVEKPLYIVHADSTVRAWNIDTRIPAIRRILSKYSGELASRPRSAARLRANMGVLQLNAGLRNEARQTFLQALHLWPLSPVNYAHFFSSLLPTGMSRLLAKKGFSGVLGLRWLSMHTRRIKWVRHNRTASSSTGIEANPSNLKGGPEGETAL